MSVLFKLGDKVAHVETRPAFRIVRWTRIVRETSSMWIDSTGDRWRKSTCALVGARGRKGRCLATVAEVHAALPEATP